MGRASAADADGVGSVAMSTTAAAAAVVVEPTIICSITSRRDEAARLVVFVVVVAVVGGVNASDVAMAENRNNVKIGSFIMMIDDIIITTIGR